MSDAQVITGTGGQTTIEEAAVNQLKTALRGELLRPADEGYEQARTVHNAMIERRPALIARCAGATDVVECVRFAREHHLLISVRSTGHNVAGSAICDGGLVIDLSRMKGLRIDAAARTARVEAGVTWGELNHDLQVFGLAAPGGFVSTTGVAGLTLGGGLGWLVRKHGLALDNLLTVDMVAADGQLLTVSAVENADLFWGVRGAGGNFGVVTSFEFRVHPAGTVLAGLVIHPITKAKEALQFWREYEATAPEEMTNGALLFSAPPAPFLPEAAHGAPVVGIGGVYAGPIDAGEQALRPLRQFGTPAADIYQPMPYSAAQTMADFLWPAGLRSYWKSSFIKEFSDAAIETILAWYATRPSPLTVVVIEHNGDGAMSRVGEQETAFGHRRWPYNFLVTSMWTDPAASETNIRWTREFWEAMQPFLTDAVYVNYLGEEDAERVQAAYGAEKYGRLVALKNKYDPTNLFRSNQNIKPEAVGV
jgi:FAD/FMN-containing dehydrogenase